MKRVKSNKVKKYSFLFLLVIGIIIVFTLIDYLVHSLSEEYSVPGSYFRNKIIFGTIIGYIALLIAMKWKIWKKALFMSAVVSVLLQTRYYLEGYPKEFVFEFMLWHFLMLLPASLLFLWFGKKFIKADF